MAILTVIRIVIVMANSILSSNTYSAIVKLQSIANQKRRTATFIPEDFCLFVMSYTRDLLALRIQQKKSITPEEKIAFMILISILRAYHLSSLIFVNYSFNLLLK